MKKVKCKMCSAIPFILALFIFLSQFSWGVIAETIDVSVNVKTPSQSTLEGYENLSNTEAGIGGTEAVTPSVLSVSDSNPGPLDVDIKYVNIKEITGGYGVPVELSLVNRSKEDLVINRMDLAVTKLDGTAIFSQSLKTNEPLGLEKEIITNNIFTGSLDPGNYLGTVEVFLGDTILGRGETVFKVVSPSPEVLGVSRNDYKLGPLILALPFLLLLIAGTLVLKKANLAFLTNFKWSLHLYDIIGIATLVSAVGSGLFVGYCLIGILKPDTLLVNYLYPASFAAIFLMFVVVGVRLLQNMSVIQKIKLSLSLFDVAGILTFVCAIGFGLFTGYGLAGLFL